MILILVIFILILGFMILLPGSRFLGWINRTLKGCVFRTVELLEVLVPKMYRWVVDTVSTLYRWIARKMVAMYRWVTDKLSRILRWCFEMVSRFLRWIINAISRLLRWCILRVKTFPTRHRILYAHIQCAIFSILPLGLTVYFETYILIALKLVTDKATVTAYSWKLSIAVDQMAALLGFGQGRILHLLTQRRGVHIPRLAIFGYEVVGIAVGALANWPHATHHHHDVQSPIWCMAFLALFPAICFYIKLVNYIVKEVDTMEPERTQPAHFYRLARHQLYQAIGLVTFGCFISAFINYAAGEFHEDVSHPSVLCYNNMAVQGFVLVAGRFANKWLGGSPATVPEYVLSAFVRAIGATPAALFGNSKWMDGFAWLHGVEFKFCLFICHLIKKLFE